MLRIKQSLLIKILSPSDTGYQYQAKYVGTPPACLVCIHSLNLEAQA